MSERPSGWVRSAPPWRAAAVLAAAGAAATGCGGPAPPSLPPSGPTDGPWLVDVAATRGLDFRHDSGARGELRLPEIMGSGAALFDADGDGDLDVYLLNGHPDPAATPRGPGPTHRFYRQEPGARFVDATERSGLGHGGYGMGVAIGDVDNDGDLDVYVSNYGFDRLYVNRGDASFEDRTAPAGIRVDGWSTSASFFDYDRDGLLDLYVARYVAYDPTKRCVDSVGRPDYCSPGVFPRAPDVLLHNEGGGRFRDVSARAGILSPSGAGLGVITADLDADGWADIFVANDGDANQLWINQRDGTFLDEALLLGVAYNNEGAAEAGMGVVLADVDSDADLDLFLTHLANETNTLYRHRGGRRGFEDATGLAGLAAASLVHTGFGCAAVDLELDGDLDLVVVNGRVTHGDPRPGSGMPPPWDRFAEPNQIYLNHGGRFVEGGPATRAFSEPIEISRGLATGDVDSDGDLDLLVTGVESGVRLFLDQAPRAGGWLSVRALDPRYHREAVGAMVTAVAGDARWVRVISRGGSYLSSSDAVAHFGLGRLSGIERIEVRWPDGLIERFDSPGVDRELTLLRGSGQSVR